MVYNIGVATFILCVVVLLAGRRIERTLELLNWVLVACILGGLFLLAVVFVPAATWGAAISGAAGFDVVRGLFNFVPSGVDFVLLAALVAYSGAGGMVNITLSNWARDKGYGMGQKAGYIPAAVGGHKVHLAHTGFIFVPDAESMRRWQGWWRIIRADQWGVFFTGAVIGMALPAVLYVAFLPAGTDIQGLGISAALANSAGQRAGPLMAGCIALMGACYSSRRNSSYFKEWCGSSPTFYGRAAGVYVPGEAATYAGCTDSVLITIALWGIFALRLAQPIILLKLAANVAAVVFVIALACTCCI